MTTADDVHVPAPAQAGDSSDDGRNGGPGARPRMSAARGLLISLDLFVALCLLASVSTYGYFRWRLGQVHGVSVPSLTPLTTPPGPGAPAVRDLPETILIVGSDTRTGESAADAQQFGSPDAIAGQRSDTIMLFRIDPPHNTATLLSIPRDLFVTIPGTSRKDRINSTFDRGPDLLVRAIHEDLNIEVNHYVALDFTSFRSVVDAVGGINVYFPAPARDLNSGLNITAPGCAMLNGEAALSYVRSRFYQSFENGAWHSEPESDLARIRRQQNFVRKMITKAVSSDMTNPARLNSVISSVVNNLTVDSGLKNDQGQLLRVSKRLKLLGDQGLTTLTIPTFPIVVNKADVLDFKQPEASQTIARFLGLGLQPAPASDAAPTPAPAAPAAAPAAAAPAPAAPALAPASWSQPEVGAAVATLAAGTDPAGNSPVPAGPTGALPPPC